jgi:hypothetical protein
VTFEVLLAVTFLVIVLGIFAAYDGSRDVFHPLVFIGPMFAFIYAWMPLKLLLSQDIYSFFDEQQLVQVQSLNLLGVSAFVLACLSAGVRLPKGRRYTISNPERVSKRLMIGAALAGGLGLLAWLLLIIGSGGPVQAFSKAYSGGWDDSGYIRDGSILLLAGVMLTMAAIGTDGFRPSKGILLATFTLPWLTQAILTSRRGPTFALVVVLGMGWYLNKSKRPPVIATCLAGIALGWLVLFLVTNRSQIYIGSDMNFTTDVSAITETPNTGNEYIYGSGSLLAAMRRETHFWGRRYMAQVLVRPIPSAIWPTKYEDFGVPELLHNAGTGEGISETMGWSGADGSAPGIVADLWVEGAWLAIPTLAVFGWLYGKCWRNAVLRGEKWIAQYTIISALSIYLVMQTMEAVVFRLLLLSIPVWLTWNWAKHLSPADQRRLARLHSNDTLEATWQ